MSADVLDRVRDLLGEIGRRAEETERDGLVPARTMAALQDAGVFRMLQPTRYGGAEAHPVDFFRVVRAVAGACGSTGWVASILGVHPWHVALFADEAQREVWGEDEDAVIASAYAPMGRMEYDGDGFRLSGRWSFSSGIDHASWVLLGALGPAAPGRRQPFLTVLVPRRDVETETVWDAIGLRGTGSNDVLVDDVHVPRHRVLSTADHARLAGPGQAVNDGPLYRIPFGAVFTSAVTMPIVGTVGGCLVDYLAAMTDRERGSLGGGRFAEDVFAQVSVARAASEIDAAVLQLEHNLSALMDEARTGGVAMETRLRARRDQVRATERAIHAVDLLFSTAGGQSLRRGNPIERAWRDAHAGSVHVANDSERALAMYGRHRFGFPVDDAMV